MRSLLFTFSLWLAGLAGDIASAAEHAVNPPTHLLEVQQACADGLEAAQDGNTDAALQQAKVAEKLAADSLADAASTAMELGASTVKKAVVALQAQDTAGAIRQFERCKSLLEPEVLYYQAVLGGSALSPGDDAAKLMSEMAAVEVTAAASSQKSLVGSGMVVDQETLFKSHVLSPNEALRKVPGVNVRDEEGFGIRPNISIRGSNPFRSTKILFLEDGLLFNFAPYGDNDMYYTPPIDRFVGVEVMKGADLTQYGPQTITGAINYVTAAVPKQPGGFASFTGGNRAYWNGHLRYGGMIDRAGGLFEYLHKEGDAARDNSFVALDDVYLKGLFEIDARQSLTIRGDFYREDSQSTFGITEAELRNFGYRYNPFKNDHYDIQRFANTATHQFKFDEDVTLMTSFYWSQFSRDWWRQMNQQPTDTQCGIDFREKRLSGQPIDVDTCNFTRGRLRDYYAWGVEPRLHASHSLFGVQGELDTGFRAHYEAQHRLTEDANAPIARSGVRIEDNDRRVDAYSGFLQNRFILGDWSVTPGLRVESVNYQRTNKLPNQAAQGETSLTAPLPSFALTYNPVEEVNLFFGVHRGFAPPRVEDSVHNNGASVEIGPESSWNYEVGMRTWPRNGIQADLTWFRNDFDRYTALGTVGGNDTPVAQGQALFQGMELGSRIDGAEVFNSIHNPYLQLAYTWLPTAVQSTPFRCLPTSDGRIPPTCPGGFVFGSRAGNRQPYAPEQLLTATIGYSHPMGLDVRLETVFTSDQFGDFLNLASGADHPNGPNSVEARSGQYGMIPSATVFNFATTYLVQKNLSLYATIKNVFDHEYIVDRVRGILPGSPRLVQAGFRYDL